MDRAGQHSARKSLDVEVFHCDQPVAFHQPAAEMMMKGGTLVSDFTVRLGHQYGGLAAATAAALATGKPALGAAEVCQPALEVSGLSISLPFERATKLSSPTSRPISSDDSGNATVSRWTEKHTYQWFTSRLLIGRLLSGILRLYLPGAWYSTFSPNA